MVILRSAHDTEFTLIFLRCAYGTGILLHKSCNNHLHTYMCIRIYVVFAIACMEAYGFLHMVTLEHALVILVVQICILS